MVETNRFRDSGWARQGLVDPHSAGKRDGRGRTELIIAAVIAGIIRFAGGLVQSLNFLLWVGISLLIVPDFAFVIRSLAGQHLTLRM